MKKSNEVTLRIKGDINEFKKTLEEKGIGRPSTYAPTITTILARNYNWKSTKTNFSFST